MKGAGPEPIGHEDPVGVDVERGVEDEGEANMAEESITRSIQLPGGALL